MKKCEHQWVTPGLINNLFKCYICDFWKLINPKTGKVGIGKSLKDAFIKAQN